MKNIKIISISLLISIIFFVGIVFINEKINIKNLDQTAQALKPKQEEPIVKNTTIYFVGDMMLARGVKSSIDKNFEGDYNRLFENLGELKEADILFANLEGAVSDVGNNVGSKYSFRMDPSILPVIKEAGFDIVSFANNHVGDWNITAFKDTLMRLEENGILKTGAGINKIDATSPTIIEKNGIKFGFLGFTDVGPNWLEAKENTAGILLASDPNINTIITNAKTKCDVLIVSFHWGIEYKTIHNSRQEELAHNAIDNGADMIIGHHPHVIQDIGEYKGKIIVYSLGNFIFDQYFSTDTMRGMLFSATFLGANLKETSHRIITLNKKYQPEGISSVEEIEEKDEENNTACMKSDEDYDDLLLLDLGQEIKLPNINYVPKKLREIDTKYSTRKVICLIDEARDAFENMSQAALSDGYVIKATSGFRSYETQKTLFNNALKVDEKRARISIAKPGHSEHQLGTAVDITGPTVNYSSATGKFSDTPEDFWLRENAHLFGFVQSYPQGKEETTGYRYESWHYRYVGLENAKKIKDGGLTITEFLKENI
jgi:LAS superfamily LD-carboxypeptidase LdcB/poly-gamma-glutamate capsule biosynthesis protein CapA/YwtB (metallophosphatase superfamily)